jgi:hydrogenase expression/formation protein HypC
MCLGVPGRVIELSPAGAGKKEATAAVDFQGSRVEVSLSLVPQAKLGDWVLVHAGYALTLLPEEEAAETWRWLELAEVKQEIQGGKP